MHIGIKIPNWGPLAGPDALVTTAIAAEDRGGALDWVHRTADTLATEYLADVAQPLVARASDG
jgi:hypothetical protein